MVDNVILDIEGTICPITFVKHTLYPYFTERLPAFLGNLHFPLANDSQDPIVQVLADLPYNTASEVEQHFNDLVARDVKDPVLKTLQGYIWKQGYEDGEITAPIYPDSIKFIRSASASKKIYIYSSGSVKAQKLLFAYVDDNGTSIDLNHHVSGYFDITTSGYKQEKSSYENILKSINQEPSSTLFLSDSQLEVQAALDAGLQSKIVKRPGNAPVDDKYDAIHSLSELDI